MATYTYTALPDKHIHRPYLKVSLDYGGKKTPFLEAVIDSGADVCMASKDIALWLGISFDGTEDEFHIATANGSLTHAIKKTVTLSAAKKRYSCPFFFVDGINPDQPPLLGQMGFFDHFKVCFDFASKTFEIT